MAGSEATDHSANDALAGNQIGVMALALAMRPME
jgi:hypothetical protein